MRSAELTDVLEEPASGARAAWFSGPGPANDTAADEEALSSGALLRFGAALVVAGAAVIAGVLMAAIAVRVRF
jgi:hypothetical protein